MPCQKILN